MSFVFFEAGAAIIESSFSSRSPTSAFVRFVVVVVVVSMEFSLRLLFISVFISTEFDLDLDRGLESDLPFSPAALWPLPSSALVSSFTFISVAVSVGGFLSTAAPVGTFVPAFIGVVSDLGGSPASTDRRSGWGRGCGSVSDAEEAEIERSFLTADVAANAADGSVLKAPALGMCEAGWLRAVGWDEEEEEEVEAGEG